MPVQDDAIDTFTTLIHAMPDAFNAAWLRVFAAKIGISNPAETDRAMIDDLLSLMEHERADFTNTFFALRLGSARDQFINRDAYDAWHIRWRDRIKDLSDADAVMAHSNPWIIPRNHQIEAMITDAVAGNMGKFVHLAHGLASPFTENPAFTDLVNPPTADQVVHATFCGT